MTDYTALIEQLIDCSIMTAEGAETLCGDAAEALRTIQVDERERCAALAVAVILNRGTCKGKTEFGEGWNQACSDINHRIMDPDAFLTQSPIPAMAKAMQAVKRDGIRLKADSGSP